MWQDIVMLLLNVGLTLPIAFMIWEEHKPPIKTSLPTALSLYALAGVQLTLELYLSSFSLFVGGAIWTVLYIQKVRE